MEAKSTGKRWTYEEFARLPNEIEARYRCRRLRWRRPPSTVYSQPSAFDPLVNPP